MAAGREGGAAGLRSQAHHLSPHEEFRAIAVIAPRTEIFDLALVRLVLMSTSIRFVVP